MTTKENVTFFSDLFLKIIAAICSVLLSIAVMTLKSMNTEIKDLSRSVQALTIESQVVLTTIKGLERRVDKLEGDYERIRR